MIVDSDITDTAGPIRVIPHTIRSVSKAVEAIQDDLVTTVMVDVCGKLMGVLFIDNTDHLYWYRAPEEGANLGIPDSMFQSW